MSHTVGCLSKPGVTARRAQRLDGLPRNER